MDTTVDLLQIKIDKAKAELPEETRRAIDAVDWKTTILGMRVEKGYSYTQLEDLELETELLLSGLINPEEYPKELEKRLGMPRAKVEELVNEMNEKVFKKIREELVKNIERKRVAETKEEPKEKREAAATDKVQNVPPTIEQLLEEKELPAPKKEESSILSQKLSGTFQIPKVETEHTLGNLSKDTKPKASIPNVDPYREIPQ